MNWLALFNTACWLIVAVHLYRRERARTDDEEDDEGSFVPTLKVMVWRGVVDGLETHVFVGGMLAPGDAPEATVEVPSYPLAATPQHATRALAAALHSWSSR